MCIQVLLTIIQILLKDSRKCPIFIYCYNIPKYVCPAVHYKCSSGHSRTIDQPRESGCFYFPPSHNFWASFVNLTHTNTPIEAYLTTQERMDYLHKWKSQAGLGSLSSSDSRVCCPILHQIREILPALTSIADSTLSFTLLLSKSGQGEIGEWKGEEQREQEYGEGSCDREVH